MGPSRLSFTLLTSCGGLSSEVVIRQVGWLDSTEGSNLKVLFLVSVTGYILRNGVVNTLLNPQPGGPGAVVSLSSHLGPVRLGQ